MAEDDPDYIDPAVLKARAARSGGAGAKPSRPRLHRVEAPQTAPSKRADDKRDRAKHAISTVQDQSED